MVILHYAILYLYIAIDVVVFGLLLSKVIGKEYARKITHIMLFGVWILMDLFFKGNIHSVIFPSTIIIINCVVYITGLDKPIEREGDKKQPGIIYFAIAISAIYFMAYLIPELYPYVGVGVLCLTLGDGAAAIFGNLIKSKKILENKSIAGTVGCFGVTLISLILYKYLYLPELSYMTIILVSILCAIFEFVQYGLDNFTVTIFCFLLAYYINNLDITFAIGIIIAIATFIWVFFAKLITYYGALLSGVYVVTFLYFGGYKHLILLFGCYLLNVIIHVIRKVKKVNLDDVVDKEHTKDVIQIFANGFFGLLPVIIYAFTNNLSFLIISALCLCACFIDSVSSDIGTMSKKQPYDFIKRKYVSKGMSGGITLLGTLASLIVSILLSTYIVFAYSLPLLNIIFYTLIIMSGTIIDSILGSCVQVKYRCSVCSKNTEKKEHCGTPCIYDGGVKVINNDVVNIISSFATFAIATPICLVLL